MTGDAATLSRWLAERPYVVLDGGLATALEARGHSLADPLWSARLLRDNPAAIREVHRDYLAAGADCVITASYQASLQGLERAGSSRNEAIALLRRSVELAREACDEEAAAGAAGPRIVAASVGPYGAYLADGSEYVGDYRGVDRDGLARFHRTRLEVLTDCCDLVACETLPSAVEAEVLLDLLSDGPETVRAWFSFACRDGSRIADGTPLADCVALCAASDRVVAVGVNCTPPGFVDSLVAEARRATPQLPIVVYPNSGELYDASTRAWKGPADNAALATAAAGWWRGGARIVGGCCRTGPDDIRRLREALNVAVTAAQE